MTESRYENLNLLWANLIIEELARLEVHHVCIAPGSRSAPLTMAAAKHQRLHCHTHFDERGLGFFALGLSKATKQSVLIICTSGTAVANLYPAFIEAAQTGVPLIVACADRPLELIGCGANQAINQPGIFARYPTVETDLCAPDLNFPPQALLGKIDDLVYQSQKYPGPALLNCPYREPFYPTSQIQDYSQYLAPIQHWLSATTPLCQKAHYQKLPEQAQSWPPSQESSVAIVLGALDESECHLILSWARHTGWPILADIQSQAFSHPLVIDTCEMLLEHSKPQAQHFDLVIQFGGRLVSKKLQQWLKSQHPHHWLIESKSERLDPDWHVSQHWSCPIHSWLSQHPTPNYQRKDASKWHRWQDQMPDIKGEHELEMIATLAEHIPANSRFMIGNSLAIREMQWVAGSRLSQQVTCFANRGCSGIDGLLATACGIAADEVLTTVLLGDTSLLHDLNSLALTRQKNMNLIVIVINNDGGGIFDLLPVPKKDQLAKNYYQLPHGLDFQAIAVQFELPYHLVDQCQSLATAYIQALEQGGAHLLEIKSSHGIASKAIRQLGERVRELTSL
ncbi:MAG: 2-succinyl-5-enolpyruvyl-6-hydroxy-3-cyclohexene-1-carboxylate synthase [Candidatus Celerinatantimonas neptuna]|nr:MAG: 2-succinyl-5-enolpyruvyl-6-hydroxy-3-cyclohexene-1-carboxylate synthase [Candidatus Celerinatantimonas neptuna]